MIPEIGNRVFFPQVGHGASLGHAHLAAVFWIDVIETGQVKIAVNQIQRQLFLERKPTRAFELQGLIGRYADFTRGLGQDVSVEGDHIGQAVILQKIGMKPAHVGAVEEGYGNLTVGDRPRGETIQLIENSPGSGGGHLQPRAAVMQIH